MGPAGPVNGGTSPADNPGYPEPDWREPPEVIRGRRDHPWIKRLEPLMEHPGRWACVSRFDNVRSAYQIASKLRTVEVKRPPGKWEFSANKTADGSGEVFARYIGPE